MSIDVLSWAFDAKLGSIEKLVLLVMIECSQGIPPIICSAPFEAIQQKTSLEEEPLTRALKSLEDAGIIHKMGYEIDFEVIKKLATHIKGS